VKEAKVMSDTSARRSATPASTGAGAIGLTFTETMRGYLSTQILDDYQAAATKGQQDNSPAQFTLTITSDSVDAMLKDPNHTASLSGTLTVPVLDPQPMIVLSGEFHLFVPDPTRVETHLMIYRMLVQATTGEKFFFDGFKVVHDDGVLNIWHDTSTLYITMFRGESLESPVIGKGILHILPKDFAHQLTTMRATNAPNEIEGIKAEGRFGRFFGGVLFETYGGLFARPTSFNPDAPPRKKRPLRVAAPEVHFFNTSDGVTLRLTRYQGGRKGPVMLLHGLGVSSSIFSIDTIGTNLLEYMFANGYDVWLLDFRASIDLPSSATQFTGDDVATKDYPAAIAEVRKLTGAADVQVLAHCYGATTFSMALCAGLQGVRSAVISQISTHIVPPAVNRIKTGLHLPNFLDELGVNTLNAYTDTHENWLSELYDKALALYPVGERCQSPVCHRITFMYAPLYQHEQLNEPTHEALHEMFGIANMRAFEGLGLMTRKGHIVAADGAESYVPHMDRMAIPIAFIHGARNECFLPESTEITYSLLCAKNGAGLYSRTVIPGYGHIDCIFGTNAVNDVYPTILKHFEATAGSR
jgi:cholesterol oxidase